MSYTCYLGGVVWPTPSKLTVKEKNKNKTLILLNDGEINFLRAPGLREILLPVTLPMLTDGRRPDFYLSLLEELKSAKSTTRFLLVRLAPDGRTLYDTNMQVSVEDYSVMEDGKEGLDVNVEINLKQWRSYGTRTVTLDTAQQPDGTQAIRTERERDASTAPMAKTYTVQAGDTLWALAARYYGAGAQYDKIFQANMDKISNPNLIYAGQVLTIP